jgi:hypothetical protein
MAKQAGPVFIVGTIDDMTFYKQGDGYYVKKKSKPSPSAKKRMKDRELYPLLNMRREAFRKASKLASKVYRTLCHNKREWAWYGALVSLANPLVWNGTEETAILEVLHAEANRLQRAAQEEATAAQAVVVSEQLVAAAPNEPTKAITSELPLPNGEQPPRQDKTIDKRVVQKGEASKARDAAPPVPDLLVNGEWYQAFTDRRALLNHFVFPTSGLPHAWGSTLFPPSSN